MGFSRWRLVLPEARGGAEDRRDGARSTPKKVARPRVGPSCKGKVRRCGRRARAGPPAFAGGRLWPVGPDRERPGSGTNRSAGVGPGNRAVQRAHPFREPGPHLTQRQRHHHRPRQTDARSHPEQPPDEVLLELEAAVQTGVDPFQGRAPTIAALPRGTAVRGGGEDAPVVPVGHDVHHAPVLSREGCGPPAAVVARKLRTSDSGRGVVRLGSRCARAVSRLAGRRDARDAPRVLRACAYTRRSAEPRALSVR